jgi:hypothetical protein
MRFPGGCHRLVFRKSLRFDPLTRQFLELLLHVAVPSYGICSQEHFLHCTPNVAYRTHSRRDLASEQAVDLASHNEVVLMQPMDLLGLQGDRRIAPTEAVIWMMAFSLRELTNLLNEGKRLPEIAKPEAPLDVASFFR